MSSLFSSKKNHPIQSRSSTHESAQEIAELRHGSRSEYAQLIRPNQTWQFPNFGEIWQRRDLLYFLVWRDLKTRYRETSLGTAWLILYPLFSVLVYTFIFGFLLNAPSDGIPYPIFVFSGITLWLYFAASLSGVSASLTSAGSLLEKVYFPRLILPIAAVISRLVDFGASLIILFAVALLFYGVYPTPRIIWLPLIVLATGLAALGIGLWLAALNVQYRDVQQALPILLRLWFLLSPITYSRRILPESLELLYYLNPIVPLLDGLRWILFGRSELYVVPALISMTAVLFLGVTGLYYFKRISKNAVDTV